MQQMALTHPTAGPKCSGVLLPARPCLLIPQTRPAWRRPGRGRVVSRAEDPASAPSPDAASSSGSNFAALRELVTKSREADPNQDLLLSRAPQPPLLFKIVPQVGKGSATPTDESPTPPVMLMRSRGLGPWLPPAPVSREVIIAQGAGSDPVMQQQAADLMLISSLAYGRALAALRAEHPQDFKPEEMLKSLDRTATLTYAKYSELFDIRNLMPDYFRQFSPENLLQLTAPPTNVRVERECSVEEVHGEVLRHLFEGLGVPPEGLREIDYMLNSFLGEVTKSLTVSATHVDCHLQLMTKSLQQGGPPSMRISWFTLTSDTFQLVIAGGKNRPEQRLQRVKFAVEYLNTHATVNQELLAQRRPALERELRLMTDAALEIDVPSVTFNT